MKAMVQERIKNWYRFMVVDKGNSNLLIFSGFIKGKDVNDVQKVLSEFSKETRKYNLAQRLKATIVPITYQKDSGALGYWKAYGNTGIYAKDYHTKVSPEKLVSLIAARLNH